MITEQETRYTCDGEGRPVKEEFGYNLYHVSVDWYDFARHDPISRITG